MTRLQFGSLNLNRLDANGYGYMAQWDGCDLGQPDITTGRRTVKIALTLRSTTADGIGDLLNDLYQELDSANLAADPIMGISPVPLLWEPGTFPLTFYPVKDETATVGSIEVDKTSLTMVQLGQATDVSLILNCMAEACGDLISYAVSGTLGMGSSGIFLPQIPGDRPALVRMTVKDQSTAGAIIQRLRFGQQRGNLLNAANFHPWIAAQPNSEAVIDPDTIGGSYATSVATEDWSPVGSVVCPGGLFDIGEFAVLPRYRDGAIAISAPQAVAASGSGGIGLVQTVAFEEPDAAHNSTTISWKTPLIDGNFATVRVFAIHNTLTPTITGPASWTQDEVLPDSTHGRVAIFSKQCSSEPTSFTVSCSINCRFLVLAQEWQGIKTSSALDQVQTDNIGSISHDTVSNIPQAVELALSANFIDDSPSRNTSPYRIGPSDTAGGKLTSEATVVDTSGSNIIIGTAYRRITNAVGRVQQLQDVGVAAGNVSFMALYKGAGIGGAMPAGTYSIQVAGVSDSGIVGMLSEPVPVEIDFIGSIPVTWAAPLYGVGQIDHYRIYFLRSGQIWKYFETSGLTLQYILATETGAINGDPPNATLHSQLRLTVGTGNGDTLQESTSWDAQLSNGLWEIPDPAPAVLPLPPEYALMGSGAASWVINLEARNTGGQTPFLDFDGILILPNNQPALKLEYIDSDGTSGTLASQRDWRYDLRADLLHSAVLLNAGVVSGSVSRSGRFLLGPGNTVVVVVADVDQLVSDLVNAHYTVQFDIIPRYVWLRGWS